MATISNKTDRPVRVPLPRGKVLHLGPRMSGEIAASALKHPALTAMVEAGEIEVVAEGSSVTQGGQAGARSGRMGRYAPASGTKGRRGGDR